MGCIYVLKNKINGKMYVGQTICNIKTRFASHRYNFKRSNSIISLAIHKYGWENFNKFIFINIPNNLLDHFEIKLIKKLNTLSPCGYNMETGGNKYKKLSRQTIEKRKNTMIKKYWNNTEYLSRLSIAHKGRIPPNKGKKMPKWVIDKNRQAQIEYYKTHFNWKKGKKVPEYIKEKIRQTLKGKYLGKNHPNSKKFICIETNKIYYGGSEAERYTGIYHVNINLCCNNKRKTAGGYHWQYYVNKEIA